MTRRGQMDVQTVVRAQGGDIAAFERLAGDVVERLHGVAWSILGDAHLAEDATQQALLAIWKELPRLRDPERFDAWAYRVVVRCCYAEGRRKPRWLPSLPHLEDAGPIAADARETVHDRDQLERGFRRLPLEQRAVLVLHHLLDLPLDAVAGVLGIPLGTAHSRLHRAYRAMRAALEADARSSVVVGVRTEAIR